MEKKDLSNHFSEATHNERLPNTMGPERPASWILSMAEGSGVLVEDQSWLPFGLSSPATEPAKVANSVKSSCTRGPKRSVGTTGLCSDSPKSVRWSFLRSQEAP